VPASLDHNDLHPGNVLDGGAPGAAVRFYDWGDAVIAHPFTSLTVPLRFFAEGPVRDAARDAYLEVFADLAPHDELVATAQLACRVALIARVLTWERALRAAREAGGPVDERWADAPRQTLLALLESLP
jgi:aminoglycoside phosphotransferase (APT) family kinase protein